MRILSLALAVTVVLMGISAPALVRRPAVACSIAPPTLESDAAFMDLLILGDVVAVGGAANEQPPAATITPTSTAFGEVTSTAESATPQRRRTEQRRTATSTASTTATPFPTSTPYPGPDLTGMRAEVVVAERYIGESGATVTLDAEARAEYERALRKREAAYGQPICGPFPPTVYEVGARYLIAASVKTAGPTTIMLVRVDGAEVVLPPNSGYNMSRATYDGYFRGLPAEFSDDGAFVYLRAERIPVATLVRAYLALRAGPPVIIPPSTGNAGLR